MLEQRWSARPVWALSLLVLTLFMSIGGPSACVIHCLVLDTAHPQAIYDRSMAHGHMHGGAEMCPSPSEQPHHEHPTPSALTIGIVLPLILLPSLSFSLRRTIATALIAVSRAIPPPREPPRISTVC